MKNKITDIYQIIRENISQRDFSFLMLVISMFLLPFSINFSTFYFLLSLGLKVVQIIFRKEPFFKTKALKQSSMIGAVFFSYIIINAIVQTNFIDTVSVFEKQFSHWALLFLAPMLLKDKKTNAALIAAFITGVIATIIWVAIASIIKGVDFNSKAFLDIVDIHHTYLSIYILFIINFIIIRIAKNKNYSLKKTSVMVLAVVIAFTIIFILGSKIAMVIFATLFIIQLFPELSKNNALKYSLIFLIITIGIFVFNKQLSTTYESALNFRTQIWDASIKIIQENPVFGNLKAPEKELLNYKHYISGKYYFLDSDLNSHNQYLSIVLKYGIFGFMLLSFFIINIFKKINKKPSKYKIKEVMGFAAILGLSFYIENILDRHHGIMFFAIFYNYYLVEIEYEEV